MQADLDRMTREYERLKEKERQSGTNGRIHYFGPEYADKYVEYNVREPSGQNEHADRFRMEFWRGLGEDLKGGAK